MKVVTKPAEVNPVVSSNAPKSSAHKVWFILTFVLFILIAGTLLFYNNQGTIFGKAIDAGNLVNGCTNTGWVNGQTYTLLGDIAVQENENCLVFNDVSGVTLDCQQNSLILANGNTADAITLAGASNVVIKNCNIYNLDVNVNGNDNVLTNNYLDASVVYLRGSGNRFANNFAKGLPPSEPGFSNRGTALEVPGSNNVIENNELRQLQFAVVMSGSNNQINENFIEDSFGLNIVGDGNQIRNNEIVDNFDRWGASLGGTNIVFENNVVCNGGGISVSPGFSIASAASNFFDASACSSSPDPNCAPLRTGTSCVQVPTSARADKCQAKECENCGGSCPGNLVCNEDGQCLSCGNGILENGEACDDSNREDGDGCSAFCSVIEPGFFCPNDGQECVSVGVCGDGVIEGAEECDFGGKCSNGAWSCTPATVKQDCGHVALSPTCEPVKKNVCSSECKVSLGVVCNEESCNAICGDGIFFNARYGRQSQKGYVAAEECEDGNIVSGDGCSADCKPEAGFNCNLDGRDPSNSYWKAQRCEPVCGDGIQLGDEQCDDGNRENGDGCSSQCRSESTNICGDGFKSGDEQCDDGNNIVGDGCTNNCRLENVCGNGIIEGNEECDDGNSNDLDGCNRACLKTPGYICDGQPSVCRTSECGNGIVESDFGEECDDGDRDNSDGCTFRCRVESGWSCSGNPSVCVSTVKDTDNDLICDGAVAGQGCRAGPDNCPNDYNGDQKDTDGDGYGDACDNRQNGQTCATDDQCLLDLTCQNGLCGALCGNGKINPGEGCDDGNLNLNDGCLPNCVKVNNWQCNGEPSVCRANCGNGFLNEGEECDDGNTVNGDGCSREIQGSGVILCTLDIGYQCPQPGQACVQQTKYSITSWNPPGGQWLEGRTYKFTNHYLGPLKILQNLNDVTIDCDGYTISGIKLYDSTSVTIENCNIVGGGTAIGIEVKGGIGNKIENNNVYRGIGISLEDTSENIVKGNLLRHNSGLTFRNTINNDIVENEFISSGRVYMGINSGITFRKNVFKVNPYTKLGPITESGTIWNKNQFYYVASVPETILASNPANFDINYCTKEVYCSPQGHDQVCFDGNICDATAAPVNLCNTVRECGSCGRTCQPGFVCGLDEQCVRPMAGSCGDGTQQVETEECDDGNVVGGDGCSANCYFEDGQYPSSGACLTGYTECGGVCTLLDKDADNCGECGRVCAANAYCTTTKLEPEPGCYLYANGKPVAPVSVSASGLLGDVNGDGCIDQSDINIMRNNIDPFCNPPGLSIAEQGDLDGDGCVSQYDINILRENVNPFCS
jgi:cysteine-rich repeat protein/parallel beta-helix repeat protein